MWPLDWISDFLHIEQVTNMPMESIVYRLALKPLSVLIFDSKVVA